MASAAPIKWNFARALGIASFALGLLRVLAVIGLATVEPDLRRTVAALVWVTLAGLFVGGVIDIALHVRARRRRGRGP
ncbi:hypothetical protein [Azospirillum sp. SYSU D00513]|uniref:hypothetical protein n=1 Tax=Azospirillum sp. SYSU D00513 TaxID=2812561 RepID=UPI001A971832|nr:hypothetical protein [Azospirillum sp. SYSU D00513]